MTAPLNILFTSAGRRVELVRAFRRAYQALGLDGRIVVTDIDPLAPTAQLADRFCLVPRINTPDYIPTLVEICRRERIAAVFPLHDHDIPVLAQHRIALEEADARLAMVSAKAAALTTDKWKTVEFFHAVGLAVPTTWLPDDPALDRAAYPLFIKPRCGSAGAGNFRIAGPRELAFFREFVANALVQEYLPGPEITSDVVCDLRGEVLTVVQRRRIEARSGEVAKAVTVCHPEITDACVRIAKALPAVGPITVQCMLKNDVPHFTEINARFGGGLPLGIAAGADSPRWLLARLAGLSVDIPPLGTYAQGLYMTRYDDSFFLTRDEHERLGRHRL